LNDANVHLINFYKQIHSGLNITIDARNDQETYYTNRDRFNEMIRCGSQESAEAAQLFYYLNRTCFNGLCRFNRSGAFNVPFGSHASEPNYSPDFEPYRIAFESWHFTDVDFESIALEPEDFIYADPPYDVEFTAYSQAGFSWSDQERAAVWLSTHPGPVILSNQKTDKIVELYESLDFKLIFREAPRRISCTGDRRDVTEVLAFRNIDSDSIELNQLFKKALSG
jgi:DNA adenine methylase